MSVLLSGGKPYTISPAPYAAWPDTDGTMLTDGLINPWTTGADSYRVGWYPNTSAVTIVIDLGADYNIDYVRFAYMRYAAAGTYEPASVAISGATNAAPTTFVSLESFSQSGNWGNTNNYNNGVGGEYSNNLTVTTGQYRKIKYVFVGVANQLTIKECEVYGSPLTSIKTINGLAKASVKTVNGLAIASVKTWNGLA